MPPLPLLIIEQDTEPVREGQLSQGLCFHSVLTALAAPVSSEALCCSTVDLWAWVYLTGLVRTHNSGFAEP